MDFPLQERIQKTLAGMGTDNKIVRKMCREGSMLREIQ